MCVLGRSELVDSVLTFSSGYDTLEYSWVKATAVFVCLQILFVSYKIPTSFLAPLPGNGSYIIFGLSRPRIFFIFFPSTFPPLPMEQLSFPQLSTPMGEFSEPSPSSSSNHELDPGFKALVRKRPFSGEMHEDPYKHLQEFEKLCSGLVILGMTQEALRWKLFPFSLIERAEQWYIRTIENI